MKHFDWLIQVPCQFLTNQSAKLPYIRELHFLVQSGLRKIVYLQERNVEQGRLRVDELEEKFLESVTVLVFRLRPRAFEVGQPECNLLITLKII